MFFDFSLNKEQRKVYYAYASQNLPRHTSYPAAPFWHQDKSDLFFAKFIISE